MKRASACPEIVLCCVATLALAVGCGGEDGRAASETGGTGGAGNASGGGCVGGSAEGGGGSGQGGSSVLLETVRAIDGSGAPLSQIDVVVSDAEGAVVAHEVTGSDGVVLVDVPVDGSVTVLSEYDIVDDGSIATNRLITTGRGIANGGTFEVIAREEQAPTSGPSMLLTLQRGAACPPNAAEASFMAGAFCHGLGSYSEPSKTFGYRPCDGDSTYDLFLFAKDSSGVTIGYDHRLDQPFLSGETFTHVLCPLQTDLTAIDVVTTDIPAGAVSATANLYGYRASRSGIAGLDWMASLAPQDSVAVFPLRFGPAAVFSEVDVGAVVIPAQPGGLSVGISHQWSGRAPQPASLQWSAGLLAVVASLPAPSVSEPGRPVLSWALSSQGTLGDAVTGSLTWLTPEDVRVTWTFIDVPQRSGSVKFPALPEALADYALTAGDQLGNQRFFHYEWPSATSPEPLLAGGFDWPEYTKVWAMRAL